MRFLSIVMGKVEEDSSIYSFSKHYLPWHGHVTALTVAPQYRRLGIAKLLTAAFEQACDNLSAWFVDLFVRAGNETAINLYQGMGYVLLNPVEERTPAECSAAIAYTVASWTTTVTIPRRRRWEEKMHSICGNR